MGKLSHPLDHNPLAPKSLAELAAAVVAMRFTLRRDRVKVPSIQVGGRGHSGTLADRRTQEPSPRA